MLKFVKIIENKKNKMMSAERSTTISFIAELIGAKNQLSQPGLPIKNLATDSRTLTESKHSLFFAIKAQRDGHRFIALAYKQGIRSFVVSDENAILNYPDTNWLIVANTLKALQDLAGAYRQLFDLPIIAITGSNGKTIVKEWLFQLLADDFTIVRSPKSYNSQIGVPLSLWQIKSWHQLGIFEAGISSVNEMEILGKIIRPNIGILTNIGTAHDEGFANTQEKLAEKLKLFGTVDTFIYRQADLKEYSGLLPGKNQFAWGFEPDAALYVYQIEKNPVGTQLRAKYKQQELSLFIPFTDDASIENVLGCWAVLLVMGYETTRIAQRFERLNRIEMRLQLLGGVNQCSLIDDSYSADIPSLAIALDFLNQQNQHQRRTLILSDLYETGKEDGQLYQEIAALVKQKKVDKLIGVGQKIYTFQNLFDLESFFFKNTDDLLGGLSALNFNHETILIKGARKFEFERIVKLLTFKTHDTVLEINLNAMRNNLQYYRSKLKKEVKIMAMVKAFSYGSGSFEIANLLQYHKVDYLAVAYVDEGIALRKAGISLPIMVMSPGHSAFEAMLQYQLEPEIYSIELLDSFLQLISKSEEDVFIHLKLDTGMHRLGFEKQTIDELNSRLKQHPKLKIKSIFTHLVASEEEQHDEFTRQQVQVFREMYEHIVKDLPYRPLRHVLNTSGISRWTDYQMDMVRLGIGLYGFDSALDKDNGLETVAGLKTTISQIKSIKAGETIGYGRRGQLQKDGRIATVKIGYADGYLRAFGNGVGSMLVNGQLAPTVGAICMDMCMLDITDIAANVGDEVNVFNADLSIADLAKNIGTIPYEILTNVSQRVKRVYYYE